MRIVVNAEIVQFAPQVERIPEQHLVKVLTPDRADQALDERMRNRDVRNRLDLLDPKYPQVGEPTVESKQRVVVGANVLRLWLAGDSVIEHPANRDTVNRCGLDTKSDEPAREHVHDHHDPMTAQ